MRLRRGHKTPVEFWRSDGRPDSGRNVDEGMAVHRTCLDERHPARTLFRQAAGKYAAGGAGPHDHIIENVLIALTHSLGLPPLQPPPAQR